MRWKETQGRGHPIAIISMITIIITITITDTVWLSLSAQGRGHPYHCKNKYKTIEVRKMSMIA